MKIIPSIRTWGYGQLVDCMKRLLGLGIELFRINLKTLSTQQEYEILVSTLVSLLSQFPQIRIMLDTDYPNESLRISIKNNSSSLEVKKGHPLKLYSTISKGFNVNSDFAIRSYPHDVFCGDIKDIIYSNGELSFEVEKISNDLLILTPNEDGVIWDGKSIHFDNGRLFEGENLQYEKWFISQLPKEYIDAIALSFTQNAKQIDLAMQIFNFDKFICKIEDICGVKRIEEICSHPNCQGIYVGRGDLMLSSVGFDFAELQKKCLLTATQFSKEALIGTDILESMKERALPNRSDMTDLCYIMQMKPTGIVLSPALSYSEHIDKVCNIISQGL